MLPCGGCDLAEELYVPEEARCCTTHCGSSIDLLDGFFPLGWLLLLPLLVAAYFLLCETVVGRQAAPRVTAWTMLILSSLLIGASALESLESGVDPFSVLHLIDARAIAGAALFACGWALLRAAEARVRRGAPPEWRAGRYCARRRCRMGSSRMSTASAVERIRPPTSRS